MQFYKYSGSGNDFIIFDNRSGEFRIKPSEVIQYCQRREGIGADGVILINSSENTDFEMRIFNADGSEAEMCGNGARCSVHFAFSILKIKKEKHFVFETMNGVYEGEIVHEDTIKIKMTELYDVDAIDINDLSGKNAMYLNTGVPHAVIQVSSVEDVNIKGVLYMPGAVITHMKEKKSIGKRVDVQCRACSSKWILTKEKKRRRYATSPASHHKHFSHSLYSVF